jgi:hypothetical protein
MKKLIWLIVLIASCTNKPQVIIDYDREADFNTYKTFSWSPQAKQVEYNYPQYDNSLNRKRIMKAIELQLTGRGYKMDTLKPDLLVNIHLLIQLKNEVRSYPTNRYRYWPDYQINIYDYEEGSLIVDLIDAKQNQLVWQGIITGVLNIKPEGVEPAINSAVLMIFSEYTYRVNND